MKQKVLLLGSEGFIGKNLYAVLVKNNYNIIKVDNIAGKNVHKINVLDKNELHKIIKATRPDLIINLVGSFNQSLVSELFKINILPSLYIYEILEELNINCRILLMGSAAEYGQLDSNSTRLKEENEGRPISFYGMSKLFQTQNAMMIAKSRKLDVIVARPFNILGNRMSEFLVPLNFIKQIKNNGTSIINTGNLDTIRDYISVTDLCSALVVILKEGKTGEIYNICSGEGISIRKVLEDFAKYKFTPKFKIKEDPKLFRSTDILVSIGNNNKLKEIGWVCKFTFEESLYKLLQYHFK